VCQIEGGYLTHVIRDLQERPLAGCYPLGNIPDLVRLRVDVRADLTHGRGHLGAPGKLHRQLRKVVKVIEHSDQDRRGQHEGTQAELVDLAEQQQVDPDPEQDQTGNDRVPSGQVVLHTPHSSTIELA